jgi:hypothetical protein
MHVSCPMPAFVMNCGATTCELFGRAVCYAVCCAV